MYGYLFIYAIIYLCAGLGFGFGTRAIARSKGFSDSWFWMGFFLGAVGLIVCACIQPTSRTEYYSPYSEFKNSLLYDSSGERKLMENEWRCPKCKKINPKYVSTCACGCSIDVYNDEILRKKEKARIESEKNEAEQKKKQEESEKRFAEITGGNGNLNATENLVIRILGKSETSLSMQDMVRKLPRSADITEFKNAVCHLEEIGMVIKEDDKYKVTGLSVESVPVEETVTASRSAETEEKADIPVTQNIDKYDEVRKCKALLDEGIISQEEFEQKKKDLLGL